MTTINNEDIQLQQEIEVLVKSIQSTDLSISSTAIDQLIKNVRPTDNNSTILAKTTKFIRPHLSQLKTHHSTMSESEDKKKLADVLSLLVMSSGEKGESLRYKLLGHIDNLDQWGHEYARNLTGEVVAEWQKNINGENENENKEMNEINEINEIEEVKQSDMEEVDMMTDEEKNNYLIPLVEKIVEFHVKHNAEQDAFDLCIEINHLDIIEKHSQNIRFEKVFVYAISCAQYYPSPTDKDIYRYLMRLSIVQKKWSDAVRLMIKLNEYNALKEVIKSNEDNEMMLKQIGCILSRIRDETIVNEIQNDTVLKAISNVKLCDYFDQLIEALQIKDVKTPQQICTSAPIQNRITERRVQEDQDSKELGLCVANCLANAGFGYDALIHADEGDYVLKGKSTLQMTSAALMGLLHLWRPMDIEQFTSFIGSDSMYVRGGSLLGIGTSSFGVTSEVDFVNVFLMDKLDAESSSTERKLSLLGIGIAYAGTKKSEIKDILIPILNNVDTLGLETAAHACLALGLIYQGSMDADIVGEIVSLIFSNYENEDFMNGIQCKMCVIGLSLLYLCTGEQSQDITETIKALPSPVNQYAMLAVTICAYAGTSNILIVQQLMEVCGNHEIKDETKENENKENNNELKECGIGVLGVALSLLSDDLSSELSRRLIDEVQRYGETCMKHFIPFAIALTSIGKAKVPILEQLSRMAHSTDLITARNSILALGLVASGTQSTRAINLLDQLAAFYSNDSLSLYAIKVAQGFVHLGKGTITLNPMYSDRLLLDPIALSGLLTFILIGGEGIERIHGLNTYMINLLALAMRPRIVCLVDKNDKVIDTQIRIGQAVDVAGQAGNPKTISGFQTYTTPQVIGVGERAELVDEDLVALTSVLEGIVSVNKH